jgi:hypothetical protein
LATALLAASQAEPPVVDPHEPVTGGIQVATTPAQRTNALLLMERARQQFGMRHARGERPYRFNVSFTASGNVAGTGPGELTETWLNGQKWRWTVQLGNFSHVRILSRGQLYEDTHIAVIPNRAMMVRNEIFWALGGPGGNARIRTAPIQWNGKPATCVLLAGGNAGDAAESRSRLWEEDEYCIDDASGTIQVHSIAPGTYAYFDYSANQQFHGRPTPNRITIYTGGSPAADASFTIVDTSAADEASLVPTPGMTTNPPPVTLEGFMRTSINQTSALAAGGMQPVVIHAEIDGEGHVVEEELSAASNPALGQPALDAVQKMNFGYTRGERQMYINVTFVPASQ